MRARPRSGRASWRRDRLDNLGIGLQRTTRGGKRAGPSGITNCVIRAMAPLHRRAKNKRPECRPTDSRSRPRTAPRSRSPRSSGCNRGVRRILRLPAAVGRRRGNRSHTSRLGLRLRDLQRDARHEAGVDQGGAETASRRNLRTSSPEPSAWRRLIATSRHRTQSSARNTVAVPPAPRRPWTRKRSANTTPGWISVVSATHGRLPARAFQKPPPESGRASAASPSVESA
jgi:hypothetical protein